MVQAAVDPDTTNALQVYDPATNTWTSGPTLNQQRSFPVGTGVGNTAIAVGGYTGVSTTTSVEVNVAGGGCASPTPTASPSATLTPTATPTATATATHTPTATPTATATFTPTATATATATHTPTATVYSNCYGYGDRNSNRDRTTAAFTDAKASSDTAAAPIRPVACSLFSELASRTSRVPSTRKSASVCALPEGIARGS